MYAEVEIPADGFVIGRAFSTLPDVHVELERIVPTDTSVVPFIWVRGADPDDVVRATRSHEAVEEIALLDEYEAEGALFRVVWRRAFGDALVGLADSGMALVSGTGTANEWRFELRAPNSDPLSEFQTWLRREGVSFTLVRLADVWGPPAGNETASRRPSTRQFDSPTNGGTSRNHTGPRWMRWRRRSGSPGSRSADACGEGCTTSWPTRSWITSSSESTADPRDDDRFERAPKSDR